MTNLFLAKTEILYYNNVNIHVSNGISGFIFLFVSKNSVLFVEEWEWFYGHIWILPEKDRYSYTAMYVKLNTRTEIVNTNKNKYVNKCNECTVV